VRQLEKIKMNTSQIQEMLHALNRIADAQDFNETINRQRIEIGDLRQQIDDLQDRLDITNANKCIERERDVLKENNERQCQKIKDLMDEKAALVSKLYQERFDMNAEADKRRIKIGHLERRVDALAKLGKQHPLGCWRLRLFDSGQPIALRCQGILDSSKC
jgi:hypothetical protein